MSKRPDPDTIFGNPRRSQWYIASWRCLKGESAKKSTPRPVLFARYQAFSRIPAISAVTTSTFSMPSTVWSLPVEA
jgi:hypothetical protein